MAKKSTKEPGETVKTTIKMPQPLWRAAHIAALDRNLDFQDVVVLALKSFLEKGNRS
jgi:hypothetical protein